MAFKKIKNVPLKKFILRKLKTGKDTFWKAPNNTAMGVDYLTLKKLYSFSFQNVSLPKKNKKKKHFLAAGYQTPSHPQQNVQQRMQFFWRAPLVHQVIVEAFKNRLAWELFARIWTEISHVERFQSSKIYST